MTEAVADYESSVIDLSIPGNKRKLNIILIALMLTMLLAALDQTIVSTALPTITSQLGGLNELSWVVTSYLLASTASTPLWGKLSDLYGRKLMLQSAVVVFLIGSALAGISQNMTQLIGFRALQGLGAGGLMVLILAVLADIVTPRDRGKYSGLFGAVFGVASVVGPLLGGLFTQHLSWRWVFYINLPIGIAAFIVLGSALHIRTRKSTHSIDWLGAALLVACVVMALLVTVWGGQKYAWTSDVILGLIAGTLITGVLFVWQERRHPEPVVPLSMFKIQTMRLTSAMGFVVGFAMFGAIVYLSIFMQVVRGATPTVAGLQLIPLMIGVLTMSIISGRVISKTGRYKIFPVVGTAVATVGMYMLSTVGVHTPYWFIFLSAMVLGAGLGSVMQVLIIAVQNSVEPKQMGAATSMSMFSRSIGGSFGTAIFGAVWAAQLTTQLKKVLPPEMASQLHSGGGSAITSSIANISALPGALHDAVLGALAIAIDHTFLVAVPIMFIAFILALFLKEKPLQGKKPDLESELASDAGVPLPSSFE